MIGISAALTCAVHSGVIVVALANAAVDPLYGVKLLGPLWAIMTLFNAVAPLGVARALPHLIRSGSPRI